MKSVVLRYCCVGARVKHESCVSSTSNYRSKNTLKSRCFKSQPYTGKTAFFDNFTISWAVIFHRLVPPEERVCLPNFAIKTGVYHVASRVSSAGCLAGPDDFNCWNQGLCRPGYTSLACCTEFDSNCLSVSLSQLHKSSVQLTKSWSSYPINNEYRNK